MTTIADNLINSITANPDAFPKYNHASTFLRGSEVPHIISEYSVILTPVSEYTTNIAVYDEDSIPLVTAEVDLYDDVDDAVDTLAFIAAVLPPSHVAGQAAPSKLRALANSYPAFIAALTNPIADTESTVDILLVAHLLRTAVAGEQMNHVTNFTQSRKNKQSPVFATANMEQALLITQEYLNA